MLNVAERVKLNISRILGKLFPFLVLFSLWELVTRFDLIARDILPRFSEVFLAMISLLKEEMVLYNLSISLYRSIVGLTISTVVGIVIGYLIGYSTKLRWFVNPFIMLTYPLPKTALVPLTMFWLGVTNEAAIFVIFLGCLLPIVVNTYNGVTNIDIKYIWSARVLGTSERKLFWRIVLPASLPYIINGVRIALPLSFILSISVELVASRAGIGTLISTYGDLGVYDYMFGAIILYILVAVTIERIMTHLFKKKINWTEGLENL